MKFLFLLLIVPFSLHAQDSTHTSGVSWLFLESNPPGAMVYIDSLYVGSTPVEHLRLDAGLHETRVYFPSPRDWYALVQRKSLRLEAGQELHSSLELGTRLSLHSVPAGATVSHQGTDLGTTPLYYRTSNPMQGTLLLRKSGYQPVTVPVTHSSLVHLEPVLQTDSSGELLFEYPSLGPQKRWAAIGSTAGMVISGVAAAYLKGRANHEFALYGFTNDPSYSASTKKYDRLSLLALTATEVSFAFLMYFLLSDN